jgi:hypothetical protein
VNPSTTITVDLLNCYKQDERVSIADRGRNFPSRPYSTCSLGQSNEDRDAPLEFKRPGRLVDYSLHLVRRLIIRGAIPSCPTYTVRLCALLLKKAIRVTGRGGQYGCHMLRIPHCLDNRLTDGGEVVRLTRRPRSTPQKHFFPASGIHFCLRLNKLQGLVRPEGLGELKNSLTSSGIEPATFRLVA